MLTVGPEAILGGWVTQRSLISKVSCLPENQKKTKVRTKQVEGFERERLRFVKTIGGRSMNPLLVQKRI